MKTSISVVIPNFNGRHLLENNLPTVKAALENSDLPSEIIVADDCSSDDSICFLETAHPDVILIKNRLNQGFSTNINSGLKRAKGSLVLALNNDVSLDKDYFRFQLPFFDLPNTFGVMGALCNPTTGNVEDGAKAFQQSWSGSLCSTKNLLPKDGSSLHTFFLSGANALMDRQKLSLIGFYDELFSPFYNEDVELGIRAWRMGWCCYFEPQSKAFHAVSQTIRKAASDEKVRFVSLRNRFFLHDIHLGGFKRVLFLLRLKLDSIFRWVLGDKTFFQASKVFFSSRGACAKRRAQFESLHPPYSLTGIGKTIEGHQRRKVCSVF